MTDCSQVRKMIGKLRSGFFDQWNDRFNFDLDVCASATNAKCALYYTEDDDGLSMEWLGTCWMNPPYGRGIGKWVKKAYVSNRDNKATVVCLLPARTDTAWWHDYVIAHAAEVVYIRGRLRFSGSKINAPFPSAVVVFGGDVDAG